MNNTEETLDFKQKHKEDLQRLRGFRLLDDDFMSKVFEDKACAEFLLQIILQRHDRDMLPPLKSLILKWGLRAQWLY